MLQTERHPFNHNIGLKTITADTRKLFVGTFPAYEVVNQLNPRMNFYYGSTDNKFWDIIRDVLGADFQFTPNSIRQFLESKNIGIIDLIEKCYRKNNRSSSDEDLTIIEQLDFVNLVQTTNCRDFYTTSKLVTELIKKQIKPLVENLSEAAVVVGDFEYHRYNFKFFPNQPELQIRIFTLYSPSDNGLRGIQKGLNNQGINVTADQYRRNQYQELLSVE